MPLEYSSPYKIHDLRLTNSSQDLRFHVITEDDVESEQRFIQFFSLFQAILVQEQLDGLKAPESPSACSCSPGTYRNGNGVEQLGCL